MKKVFHIISGSVNPSVAVAVGILLLISPRTATNILMIIAGVLLMGSGVMTLLENSGGSFGLRNPFLPGAVVNIALGAFMALSPSVVMRLACTIIGIYLLLVGLTSLNEHRNNIRWYQLIPLILGIIVLLNPLRMVFTVVQWAGIGMLANGIIGLTASNLPRR